MEITTLNDKNIIIDQYTGEISYYDKMTGELIVCPKIGISFDHWFPSPETNEQFLDRMDIAEIEQYLRKKKLNNINHAK